MNHAIGGRSARGRDQPIRPRPDWKLQPNPPDSSAIGGLIFQDRPSPPSEVAGTRHSGTRALVTALDWHPLPPVDSSPQPVHVGP
jgi:hypothetical protein